MTVYYLFVVLKRTRLFEKAHAVFDQGRGFERGEGTEFAIPLMAFFNIHVTDIFTIYRHFTCRGTVGLWPFIDKKYNVQCSPSTALI